MSHAPDSTNASASTNAARPENGSDPSPTMAPSERHAAPWMVFALLAASFVGGAGTLWGGWVGDDTALVRDADVSQSLSKALAAPQYPAPGERGAYRPVTLASFALTSGEATATAPRDPFLDHVVNVLLHVLGTGLLFFVFARSTGSAWIGFGGALVFAVHPLHVATIASLAGRADLLAVVFGSATALAWHGVRRGNLALLPAAGLGYLLAIGSHEIALGLPIVLALLPRPAGHKRRPLALLVFAPALVLYGMGGADRLSFGLGFEQVWAAVPALGRTALAWIAPVRLAPEHAAALSAPDQAAQILGLVVVALFLFAAIRLLLGRGGWVSRAWVGGCTLVLVAACVSAATGPFGLSLGYAFTAALALIAGCLGRALIRDGNLLPAVLGLVGFAALAVLSVYETPHWRTEELRFTRRLSLDPDDSEGQELFARHLRREAAYERRRAATMRAEAPERGVALRRRDALLTRAMAWATRAVEGDGRTRAGAWREHGLVLAARQQWAKALPILTHAVKLDARFESSDNPQAAIERGELTDAAEMFFTIGAAHEAMGQRADAADPYVFASELAPNNSLYLRRAGQALTRVARYNEGLALLRLAFQRAPDREERDLVATLIESEQRAASTLTGKLLRGARAAQTAGNYRVAVREYERALDVDDKLVEAMIQVGYLRGWHFGNYRVAYGHLDRAQRVLVAQDPQDPRLAEVAKYRTSLQKQEAEEPEQVDGEPK